MCGCASGSSVVAPSQLRIANVSEKREGIECEYTIEQINAWLKKIECVKAGGFIIEFPSIRKKQLNIYIGILLSAKNYIDNICYFKPELDEIESFITLLISKNICPES